MNHAYILTLSCPDVMGILGMAGQSETPDKRQLHIAVTPTFARSIRIPLPRQFTEAYPEIDLTVKVSIPLLNVVAEDADLIVRFGLGRYADLALRYHRPPGMRSICRLAKKISGLIGVRVQIHRDSGTPFGCDAPGRNEIGF